MEIGKESLICPIKIRGHSVATHEQQKRGWKPSSETIHFLFDHQKAPKNESELVLEIDSDLQSNDCRFLINFRRLNYF
jgi:hypothetical protein